MEAPDATRHWAPRNTLIFFPLHKNEYPKFVSWKEGRYSRKFIAAVAATPSARRVAVNKP
jgi:hypothetical protein